MGTTAPRRARTRGASCLALATLALLAGCASGPRGTASGRDGADANPPANLDRVPDAEPRIEAIRGNGGTGKPYTVLGQSYAPITDDRPFRERGLASWYGRKFNSVLTASGEPYDMYAMTAAHKTLPLPSYVRVRNPANGREVIVRVNDRGPFHEGRVIDLSYTAALRLDLLRGVAPVEIERITNEDIRTGAWRRGGDTMLAAAPASAAPVDQAGMVAVPAVWTVPVVAAPAAPGTARGGAVLLAQAPATEPTATDAPAPPPRFRDMQITDLPPLAPAAPTASPGAAPAAPASSAPMAAPGAAPAAPASSARIATPTASPGSAAPPASAAETAPPAAVAAGFWVQLGAFRERDSAELQQAQAARGLPALAPRLRVFSEGGTHRLQAGPFASREAAVQAASQVREGLRIAPLVVERR